MTSEFQGVTENGRPGAGISVARSDSTSRYLVLSGLSSNTGSWTVVTYPAGTRTSVSPALGPLNDSGRRFCQVPGSPA